MYIDDIVIFGRDQREHDQRLKKVLQIAVENNIRFNRNKCRFSVPEVKYMG